MLQTLFKIIKKLSKTKASNKKSLLERAFFYLFWKLEEREERKNLAEDTSFSKTSTSIIGSERAVLIETILQDEFSSLLDVGTAFGQNLFILSKIIPSDTLYGIDVKTSRMVLADKIAEEKNLLDLSFLSANSLFLPFLDKTIDTVIASALFLYLDDEESFVTFKELARISSKRIIILEQHVRGIASVCEEGEVTGGKFWIRDYYALFDRVFGGKCKVVEHKIFNPRWQVEKWENTGVVFEIFV